MMVTKEQEEKFMLLYERYKKQLTDRARKELRDEQMVLDVLQETFLKIALYIDVISKIECHKTYGYLVAILENTITDMYRKNKHEPRESFEELEPVLADDIDLLDRLLAEDIATLIGELPEKYRVVMQLRAYHEMSEKQIADVLGINYATVRKRLERGRAMLGAKMTKWEEADYCER